MYARILTWNLRHRRWRHLLNVITMAVTISVVMLFVSVMAQMIAYVRKGADNELLRALIVPKMVTGEVPLAMHATFKSIDGVQVVQRYKIVRGRHESGARYVVVGEEETIELTRDFFPVDAPVIEAWKKERNGAIVTEATARDLRLEVGRDAEVPTPYGPLKIKVVGLSRGALVGQRIAVHFDYLRELAGDSKTCDYRIFTKPADFERVARAIGERTRNSGSPVEAVSSQAFAESFARKAGAVPLVLGFLGAFLILVTALTLANNTAIAIRERRIETATMRVLGYRRSTIVKLILLEVIIVGLIGGIIAIVATSLLLHGGVQLTPGASQLLRPVEIGTAGIACGIVASIVVPLAGALPSVLAAMRVPLVDALRDHA